MRSWDLAVWLAALLLPNRVMGGDYCVRSEMPFIHLDGNQITNRINYLELPAPR